MTATDPYGLSDSVTLTITVTDVDEAPGSDAGEAHPTVEENRTDYVGRFTASDPEGDAITWSALSGSDAGDFDFDTSSGDLTFKTPPDFDTPQDANRDNVYLVNVNASAGGKTGTLAVTVTVTNVNEAPEIAGPDSVDFAEDGRGMVASYSATDPEGGTVVWQALAGVDSGAFTFSNGVLRFAAPPDFEDPTDAGGNNEYRITVRASDGPNDDRYDVTVTVGNIEEVGTLALSSEQPQTETVLTATLTDPDRVLSASWTWERSRNRSSWSVISGETASSYTPADADLNHYLRVTVEYSDGHGAGNRLQESSDHRTQAAPGANQAPEFTAPRSNRDVAENSPVRAPVGAPVTANDPDDATLSYTLSGPDASFFAIDRSSGQIRVGAGTQLDHEARSSYSVTVTATDPSNASDSIPVDITVTDVNEAPEVMADTATTLEDGSVTVNVLDNADDPDADDPNDTLTVSLRTRPANGVAAIDAATNDITYTPNANYHGADSFSYTVSDDDGLTSEQATVNVTVTSVNDPPAFPTATAERTVAPGADAGANVGGPVTATDVEGDVLTYALTGPGASSFEIEEHTGQLTLREGVSLDADVQDTYAVTVTAREVRTDSEPVLDASIEVTITVTAGGGGGGGGGGGFGAGPGEVLLVVTAAVAGEEAPAGQRFGFAFQCTPPEGTPGIPWSFSVGAGQGQGRFVPGDIPCTLAVTDAGGADRVDGLFTALVLGEEDRRVVVTFTYGIVATISTSVALDAETVVEEAGVSLTIPAGSRAAPYAVLLETGDEHCEGGLQLDGESIACHTVTVYDADGEEEEESIDLLVSATVTITLDAAIVEELGGLTGVRAARARGELRMRQRDDADSPWREIAFTVQETDDGGVEIVVSVQQFSDFALVTAPPRLQTVALHDGWTVVVWDGADGASIPDALGDLGDRVDVIYQWVAETQVWTSFRPGAPAFLSAFDTFTRGATYWLRASDDIEWTVVGGPLGPPAAEPTRLHSRWTEVVWRGVDGAGIADALGADVFPQVEVIYRWDAETQTWTSFRPGAPAFLSAFDTFQTGASYWIAVAEAVEWNIPPGGG